MYKWKGGVFANMKNIIKTVVSSVIILVIIFFNVTFDFTAWRYEDEQNRRFVQVGAEKAWAAGTATYILPISEDVFAKSYTSSNYGTSKEVLIGITGDGTCNGYFKADLSSIPFDSSDIVGATLYVYCWSTRYNYIHVYRTASGWSESTLTGVNMPGGTGESIADILIPGEYSQYGWLTANVTSDLIRMINGTYGNFGWVFTGNGGYTQCYSREYTESRPFISITYRVNEEPTISVASPSPNGTLGSSFVPSISVSDADGDILTCNYYLDSNTTPRDTKQISNTATVQNISFKILDTSTLSDGPHSITFDVSDGKAPAVRQTVSFTIDRTPPEINTVTYTSSDKTITVSGSAKAGTTDLHPLPYKYTVNGVASSWTTDTSYPVNSVSPNTKYTVKFEARDKLENTASEQKDIYTKAQIPSLTITGTAETALGLKITDENPVGTEYQIMSGGQYVDASGILTDTVQWTSLTNKNININGLLQNTRYTISAKARNTQGTVTDAAQISGTTLAKAPNITFSEIKQTSIKLTWPAVAGATGYEVEADGTSKGKITGTEYVHSDLTPETSHRYRIRVTNAGGEGVWGSSFNVTTLPYAPAVPTNIQAVETQTNITLTWDKAAKATSYEIEINGGTVPVNAGNVLTFVHKGLTPDTGYKYRIRAKNAGGVSGWSETVSIVTLPVPPPTPSGITINKTNTSVTVSWAPAERAESYRIEVDGQIIDNKAQTSYKHEGLQSLSSHKYRIKALNRGGSSEWSEIILAITNPDKPETPVNIIAASDETSINLTWYEVRYAESYEIEIDGSSTESTTESAFALNGLKPDSSHTFKIKAVNITGISEWSKSVTISTFPETSGGTTDEDISLTNVIAVVTNNNITLSWDDVAHEGAYEIEVDGKLSDNGKSTAYNHTGLTAETYHTYKIRLKNSDADSNETNGWCAVLTLSTLPDIPDAPKGLSATASNNSIEIRWDRVEGATGYEVEMDGVAVDAGAQEGYIQQPLDPGTSHTYRVRARNITGVTAWSEAVSQSTTNPTCLVECIKGEELSLSLTVSEVQDFTGLRIVVTYNSDELELADLYGFTPKRDVLSEGTIPGTNLKVKYEPGRMEFTMDESITPGTMWSGEITNIIFMPKISGQTQINFTQE